MSDQQKGGFEDDLRSAANKLGEEAEKTAKEFRESWNETTKSVENKKVLAGILAILLGGFGIHKFILGYNREGIILIILTVVIGTLTFGLATWVVWVITMVEGIIYLTKSDDEFYETYQANRRPWF